jgi:hypothetical protein
MVAMATAKSTTTAEVSDIQRRMAQIRHELHQEVQEAVKGAQSLTDWRSQVRNHPWLALGAAAAVGYLVVPKRRSETPAIASVRPPAYGLVAAAPVAPVSQPRGSSWSVLGTAFNLLAPVAVRAAQNYVLHNLEQMLTPQPSGPAETRPGPRPGGGARTASPFGAPGQPRDAR